MEGAMVEELLPDALWARVPPLLPLEYLQSNADGLGRGTRRC